jgi:hypothetical protein
MLAMTTMTIATQSVTPSRWRRTNHPARAAIAGARLAKMAKTSADNLRSAASSSEYGITEHIKPTTSTRPATLHRRAASKSIVIRAAGAVTRAPRAVANARASRLAKTLPTCAVASMYPAQLAAAPAAKANPTASVA